MLLRHFCWSVEGHWQPIKNLHQVEPGGFHVHARWLQRSDAVEQTDARRPQLLASPPMHATPGSALLHRARQSSGWCSFPRHQRCLGQGWIEFAIKHSHSPCDRAPEESGIDTLIAQVTRQLVMSRASAMCGSRYLRTVGKVSVTILM